MNPAASKSSPTEFSNHTSLDLAADEVYFRKNGIEPGQGEAGATDPETPTEIALARKLLGFTAARGSQIGSSAANAWGLGPSITWAAFDLGSVRARLRGADADAEGALATYEQQVLLALEESENAFSDYGKRQQRLISLIRQSESSRAAADLAQIRYREGTADFLVLLDAQRERLAAEDSQAQAEIDLYRGIVAIYKALGGGWQPETVASQ